MGSRFGHESKKTRFSFGRLEPVWGVQVDPAIESAASGALWKRTHPSGVFPLVGVGRFERLPVGVSAAQIRPDLLIEVLPGIARSHRNPDFANRHADLCPNFQQLRADGGHLRLGQIRGFESQPPKPGAP